MENFRLVVQTAFSGANSREIFGGCQVLAASKQRRRPKKRHVFTSKSVLL
jgi:hypothetical protein